MAGARTFNHVYTYELKVPPLPTELVPRDRADLSQKMLLSKGKPAGLWFAEGMEWIQTVTTRERPYLGDLFTRLLVTKDFPPPTSAKAVGLAGQALTGFLYYQVSLPQSRFTDVLSEAAPDKVFVLTSANLPDFLLEFYTTYGVNRIMDLLKELNPGQDGSGFLYQGLQKTVLRKLTIAGGEADLSDTPPKGTTSVLDFLSGLGFDTTEMKKSGSNQQQFFRGFALRIALTDILKSLPPNADPTHGAWKTLVAWQDITQTTFATYGLAKAVCGTATTPKGAQDTRRLRPVVTPETLEAYCGTKGREEQFNKIVRDPTWIVDPPTGAVGAGSGGGALGPIASGLYTGEGDSTGFHNYAMRVILGHYFEDVFGSKWGGILYDKSLFERPPPDHSWLAYVMLPSLCLFAPTRFLGTGPLSPIVAVIVADSLESAKPLVDVFQANPALASKIAIAKPVGTTVEFLQTPPAPSGGRHLRGRTFRRKARRRNKNGSRLARQSLRRRHK